MNFINKLLKQEKYLYHCNFCGKGLIGSDEGKFLQEWVFYQLERAGYIWILRKKEKKRVNRKPITDQRGETKWVACMDCFPPILKAIENHKEITEEDFKESGKSTFTDFRDNKVYYIVRIGNQIWMAENLAFKCESGCWSYENDESNASKYGYLYNWETANKVCPSGWHLPSDAEWKTLISYLGGAEIAGWKLKENGLLNWNPGNESATNESGFAALPAGFYKYRLNSYNELEVGTYFWCSTKYNNNTVLSYNLWCDKGRAFSNLFDKQLGLSVRCIRDY